MHFKSTNLAIFGHFKNVLSSAVSMDPLQLILCVCAVVEFVVFFYVDARMYIYVCYKWRTAAIDRCLWQFSRCVIQCKMAKIICVYFLRTGMHNVDKYIYKHLNNRERKSKSTRCRWKLVVWVVAAAAHTHTGRHTILWRSATQWTSKRALLISE